MNKISFYIHYFFKELCHQKWLFLFSMWCIAICGVIFLLFIPNQYKTRAALSIDTDEFLSQVVKDSTFSLQSSTRAQVQKVSQIIYAADNLRRVIRNVDKESYKLTPEREYILVELLRKKLSFVAKGKDYYEISYTHSDPEVAYNTLKEILDIFIETNIKELSTNSDQAQLISSGTVRAKQKEFSLLQKRYTKFRQDNIDIIDPNNVLQTTLNKYRSLLENNQTIQNSLRRRIDRLQSLLKQTAKYTQEAIDPNCDLRALRQQIMDYKARGLKENHPDIRYVQDLMETRKKECPETEGGVAINPAYSQILSELEIVKEEHQMHQINLIKAREGIPKIETKLAKQPVIMGKLELLEKQKDRAEQELSKADVTNTRLKDTLDLNRKTGLVNYDIIQRVTFPVKPEKPNRMLLFVGCFIAAIIASAGLIILRVHAEERMPTIYHLKSHFDIPILGSIMRVYHKGHKRFTLEDEGLWFFFAALLIILYAAVVWYFAIHDLNADLISVYKKLFGLGDQG